MSVEALPTTKPAQEAQVDPATVNEIDAINPSERPALSPFGSRLVRAAQRVNAYLEQRAITKDHTEALAENQNITGNASEEDLISTDHEAALKMNRRFDRNEAIKQRIHDIGRRGLVQLKSAGEITLGIGIIGAEAARNKATNYVNDRVDAGKQVYEQTKESAINFVQEKRNSALARKQARVNRRQEERDARQRARDESEAKIRAEREARLIERVERARAAREQAAERARHAAERKQARRDSRREKITAGRDKANELWQNAQTKRRVIGAKAVAFKTRARASGQAAIDTWQQYNAQNQL